MSQVNTIEFIKNVLKVMPSDWIKLTTHRLDIYDENQAKVDFLNHFEKLMSVKYDSLKAELDKLPTAYDYIRLGHPLSCILEWGIAKLKNLNVENVISFSSQNMPILAILRKNLFEDINTQIIFDNELPNQLDTETLRNVYGYKFILNELEDKIKDFDGSTIFITQYKKLWDKNFNSDAEFIIAIDDFGSIALIKSEDSKSYVSEIQHVRRRESIAMTPVDCLMALNNLVGHSLDMNNLTPNMNLLVDTINDITNTSNTPCIGSSGLSVQYAIMMGLIHNSMDKHPEKAIKFIVPPNCYGGTNDQARRVAACIPNVEVVDLPVDGGQDMVESLEKILEVVANEDAVPFIIAEIPTNPRVEVPHLISLRKALIDQRKTQDGSDAIAPVFILDQTFCPNVKFLGDGDILYDVATISYVSGSKFPSGGLCTAGYCVANTKAQSLVSYIDRHLKICDNEATDYQLDILAKQMPSMNKRIADAYKNTREFVNHIHDTLPTAKINFVSEGLADIGFTPSVFSLDLPTKGDNPQEKESFKRALNLTLINSMINKIPLESKFCVSYGQLQGCYWTIPATSTQGTTKEGDKDYIVRVSVSPNMNLDLHKKIFSEFCREYIN